MLHLAQSWMGLPADCGRLLGIANCVVQVNWIRKVCLRHAAAGLEEIEVSKISQSRRVPSFPDETPGRIRVALVRRLQTVAGLLILLEWFTPIVLGQAKADTTGRLEGVVFVGDANDRSYVPGAKVLVSGPVMADTETDAAGKYVFAGLLPGSYEVEASFSELTSYQAVTVEPNRIAMASLQLKPPEMKSTINVAAKDERVGGPSPSSTINGKIVQDAPNIDEQFESLLPLVPGVVRGPDGRLNLKGTRSTQSGALLNSANATDPATGSSAISLPIDVVSSVEVISNPYDPQYGRLTGAVAETDTKTGNYEGYHFTIQNVLPRWRERGGSIVGIGAATPRLTLTGPLIKDKVALTESFEYRFLRTPVNSLPPLQRDTKLEGFNSYSQLDFNLSPKQTATVALAVYPQKLDFLGLNTFTPQPSTADFHQRGYQMDAQDRYLVGGSAFLTSQISYKRYDVDTTAQSNLPYELLVDTTEGGYFNRQARRATRLDWRESYNFAPKQWLGSHELKVGIDYAYSSFHGLQTFLPVELIGDSGAPIERIAFTQPGYFDTNQNEIAWWVADQWSPWQRLTFNAGVRVDRDTITSSTHAAPRAGFLLALTSDGKTLLKGGVGVFYDKVPLILPVFENYPDRTVSLLAPDGQVLSSTSYLNRITGGLQNPRSTSWNLAFERKVFSQLTLRVAYEQRNTTKDFVVSPTSEPTSPIIALSNSGSDSYKEFQVGGRYRLAQSTLNASYVHSRAYGNLNDPSLFFGTYPQAVIQPDARGRLPFDAPNRFLFWGDLAGPWKLTLIPVLDVHTGFPYSIENQYREYIGQRDSSRFPRFTSCDLQVSRPISIHVGERRLRMRAGLSVFNLFNHFNPRDVQNDINSTQFGGFFNDAWREYRGKLVFEF